MAAVQEKLLSVVVPALNEETLIGETVEALLASIARFEGSDAAAVQLGASRVELLVVDNASTDRTLQVLGPFERRHGVRVIVAKVRGAARARNDGARASRGRHLLFVDADTLVPADAIERVVELCERQGVGAGIALLAAREGGLRARAWWAWWDLMRRLPLARAKAMPAFLFCTREVFERYGPFDEAVEIGEEWPILADLYRREPGRFRFERGLVCRTSSRRMELRAFGYLRLFVRYNWAVWHASGRVDYDQVRHPPPEAPWAR